MANKSFRQDVDSRLAALTLSLELRQNILAAAPAVPARPQRRPRARGALVALAACLALVFGVAAAAAVFPGFERLVANVGEEVRVLFSPASGTALASGLQLEVVAALYDGDSAIVYVTLQDLEKNRVDENTRLFNPQLGELSFVTQHLAHYDPVAGIATFRLEGNLGIERAPGNSLTLQVDGVLLGEKEYEAVDTGLTLASIQAANAEPKTAPLELPGNGEFFSRESVIFGGDDEQLLLQMEQLLADENLLLLAADGPVCSLENGWLEIEAAGVIDGWLHLRQSMTGPLAVYNSVSPYLESPYGGGLAVGGTSVGYRGERGSSALYDAYEWLLQLPENVPADHVRIMAGGTGYSGVVEDTWRVRFRLEEPEAVTIACDIPLDGWRVHTIVVSSIGVALEGEVSPQTDIDRYINFDADVVLRLTDGSETEFYSWYGGSDFEGRAISKNSFSTPLALEDMQSVSVNGQIYSLKDL